MACGRGFDSPRFHQSRSPNHSRLGLFFVQSRQKPRVVAGSCGRLRTSPAATLAPSWAGFALSGAVLSQAPLSWVGAKFARAGHDSHVNQQLTSGLIGRASSLHWVAEGKPNRLGSANRSTEDEVWRSATTGGVRADTSNDQGSDGQQCAVQLTDGRDLSMLLDNPDLAFEVRTRTTGM